MKIVYFEWTDAIEAPDGWKSEKEVNDWIKNDEFWIKQTGFLVKEDKKFIVIASNLAPKTERYATGYGNIFRIPKTWIRNRVTLKSIK